MIVLPCCQSEVCTQNLTLPYTDQHCATSQKVEGSIPDVITGIFHRHNPSGRTMSFGLTQPVTEMSTRNTSWGIKAAGA